MRLSSGVFRTIIAIAMALAIAACDRADRKIVGKWRVDDKQTIEFFQDKTIVLSTPVTNFSGVYSFVSDDRVKMEFGGVIIGFAGPQIVRVTFDNGDLVMDADQNSSLFSGHHVLKRIGG